MKKLFLAFCILFSLSAQATDENSLWLFRGRVVLNGSQFSDYKSNGAFQISQVTKNLEGGYINEASLDGVKRDGLYLMYRIPFSLTDRLKSVVAGGLYGTSTTIEALDKTDYTYQYGVTLMSSLGLEYRITHDLYVQTRYQHQFLSSDKRDTDMFMAGLGYSFPPKTRAQKYEEAKRLLEDDQ